MTGGIRLCRKGLHEMTGYNLERSGQTTRCRACRRAYVAQGRARARRATRSRARDRCRNGHIRTPENTQIRWHPVKRIEYRHCRTCRKASDRERNADKRLDEKFRQYRIQNERRPQ